MAQAASCSLPWSWPGPPKSSVLAWPSKSFQPGETGWTQTPLAPWSKSCAGEGGDPSGEGKRKESWRSPGGGAIGARVLRHE